MKILPYKQDFKLIWFNCISNMAQSRILSCVSKYEELLSDLHEVEKIVSKLQKDATKLKKKFFGSRAKADATKNKINSDDIHLILQDSQNFDCQMLKIQQLLNKCNVTSFFIQRQLELREYQNQTPPALYM